MTNLAELEREYRLLPMDKLSVGKNQTRTRNTTAGIEELAASIEKVGLLEPIIVIPTDKGQYEIITGQRRFLAFEHLGRTKIPAMVLDEAPDEVGSLTISLTENMMRKDPSQAEYIEACTRLFHFYGDIGIVAEQTGLSKQLVNQYVKAPQLSEPLERMVHDGRIELKKALIANDASRISGGKDEDFGIAIAEKIERENMGPQQASKFAKAAQKIAEIDGTESVMEEDFDRLAKKTSKSSSTVTVGLTPPIDHGLVKYATDEGTNKRDAAGTLITEGLQTKGYLTDSE